MGCVFLNGDFIPAEQAFVSVLDRGFIFGDGVYELIPCYGAFPLRLREHLQRLAASLAAIRIRNPYDENRWNEIIRRVIDENGGKDVSIYMQVTRGVAPRDHAFPVGVEPTVFVMAKPLPVFNPAVLETGVSVITAEDIRWRYCNIKAISLLPNVLMRQQAQEQGATEAILLRDGTVTEGSASNVFIVDEKGLVLTPPQSEYLLPGITRDLLLELMGQLGMPCAQAPISRQQLLQAREVWISSSLRDVQPVTRMDGRPVGDGKPGPVWRRAYDAFAAYKEEVRRGLQ